jgi:hypothetical protein
LKSARVNSLQENTQHKTGLVECLKVQDLSSSPSAAKNQPVNQPDKQKKDKEKKLRDL